MSADFRIQEARLNLYCQCGASARYIAPGGTPEWAAMEREAWDKAHTACRERPTPQFALATPNPSPES